MTLPVRIGEQIARGEVGAAGSKRGNFERQNGIPWVETAFNVSLVCRLCKVRECWRDKALGIAAYF